MAHPGCRWLWGNLLPDVGLCDCCPAILQSEVGCSSSCVLLPHSGPGSLFELCHRWLQPLTPAIVCRFGTDEEKLEGLAADLGIKTLPAFRFYKDGRDAGISEIVGYKKKPLTDAVEKFIKQ